MVGERERENEREGEKERECVRVYVCMGSNGNEVQDILKRQSVLRLLCFLNRLAHSVAVCCIVLQCVAVCCSVLQSAFFMCRTFYVQFVLSTECDEISTHCTRNCMPGFTQKKARMNESCQSCHK